MHFIDLPGFTKDIKPLEEITIQNLAAFTQKELDKIDSDLDRYILCGISMGFLLLCHLKVGDKCIGITAIEPCLDTACLKLSSVEKRFVLGLIKFVSKLDLSDRLLHSDTFVEAGKALNLKQKSNGFLEKLREHVDGKTLVETAQSIITHNKKCKFNSRLPHVLIMNTEDEVVNYDYVVREMSRNIPDLLIMRSTMPHHPKDWSRGYFEKNFPPENFEKLEKFFLNRMQVK